MIQARPDQCPVARPPLMTRMMSCLGIDAGQAEAQTSGFALARVARTCNVCPRKAECAAWLAESPGDDAHWSFCPNADLFERMPRIVRY